MNEDEHKLQISSVGPEFYQVEDFYKGTVFSGSLADCQKFVQWQEKDVPAAANLAAPAERSTPGRPVTLTLTAAEFETLCDALTDRIQALASGDFDSYQAARPIGALADKLDLQAAQPIDQQYERLLRATAAIRHPDATPELERNIDRTIQKRLSEFTQERRQAKELSPADRETLRAYREALTADVAKHGTISPEQSAHYAQRIQKLCDQAREELAERSAAAARTQDRGRGRGMER